MKIQKLTFSLLILVFGTLGFAFATTDQTPKDQTPNGGMLSASQSIGQQQKNGNFPVADYNEAELTDAKKNEARKEKKRRHNNFSIVAKNPPEWQAQRMFIDEGLALTPALPVAKCEFIVLGEVKAAEAHVSENKENVYSEFTVLVNKVFKTASSSISEGTEITIDRIG